MIKEIATIGLICLLLAPSASVIPHYNNSSHSSSFTHFNMDGKTLYVGGDGPNNYTSIQDAINDANDGDTIFVYDDSSPYYENLVINKSIKLIGENRKKTIIDGMRENNTITIKTSNVFIINFTIRNGSIGICVNSRLYTGDLENMAIKHNIVADNLNEGISIWHSNHCIIYGNTVQNDTWGICLYGSYFNKIYNNNLIDNEENMHIYYWKNWHLFWTNRIIRNYWDNWRIPIPKPIIAFFYPLYPLIQFDWMPRLFPYEKE